MNIILTSLHISTLEPSCLPSGSAKGAEVSNDPFRIYSSIEEIITLGSGFFQHGCEAFQGLKTLSRFYNL